ncbi:hypothetical protein [Chromobacterium amazonense]|uniref:hypothetical protein n=1 Tax=Chromobacterium amazonense TaxID=1382803 RepID=UPI003F7A8853
MEMELMVVSVLMPSVLQLFYFSFLYDNVGKGERFKRDTIVCMYLPLALIVCGVLYLFSGPMTETLLVSLAMVPGGVLGLITGMFFDAWAIRRRAKDDADERD